MSAAQMVCAQRLPAKFPLRKFCSVANLNFKCFAWYVRLLILFDKNVCDWVFNLLETLWKILKKKFSFFYYKKLAIFKKRGIQSKIFYTLVPACSPALFLFYPLSTAFEKVCGEIFDRPIILIFLFFFSASSY